jgi:hypothetical protein
MWHLAVDTRQPAPGDIYETGQEPLLANQQLYRVEARSSVAWMAHGRQA